MVSVERRQSVLVRCNGDCRNDPQTLPHQDSSPLRKSRRIFSEGTWTILDPPNLHHSVSVLTVPEVRYLDHEGSLWGKGVESSRPPALSQVVRAEPTSCVQDQLSTRKSFISGIVSLGVVISTLLALRELIYEVF